MSDKTAADLMRSPVETCHRETNLEEAARQMLEADVGSLLVVDDEGRLVGILTDADFSARKAGVPFSTLRMPQVFGRWVGKEGVEDIYEEARRRQVEEIMSRPVHSVDAGDSLRTILDVMLEHDVKHVPVVRDGKPIGIVTRHHLLRLLHDSATR